MASDFSVGYDNCSLNGNGTRFFFLMASFAVKGERNNFMVKLKIVLNVQNFSAQNYMLSFSVFILIILFSFISAFKA